MNIYPICVTSLWNLWRDVRRLFKHTEDVFKMLPSKCIFLGREKELALTVLIRKVNGKKANLC